MWKEETANGMDERDPQRELSCYLLPLPGDVNAGVTWDFSCNFIPPMCWGRVRRQRCDCWYSVAGSAAFLSTGTAVGQDLEQV